MMEENDFDLKTNVLSLEELAVIAAASHLWELPDIENQLKTFLHKYYGYRHKGHAAKCFNKTTLQIPKMVSQILKRQHLPEVLKKKVERRIWEMGEKTFNWVMHLTHDLNLDVKYAEKIYWTSTGRIDVDKIFKSSWMNFPVEEKTVTWFSKDWFYNTFSTLHVLACFFAQEDFIINAQADIVKEVRLIFPSFEIGNDFDVVYDIMSIVISGFREYKCDNSFYWLKKDMSHLGDREPRRMLDISIKFCFHKAFAYFWKKAEPFAQYKYLELVSQCDFFHPYYIFKFGEDNLFQIVFFLMEKMNPYQVTNFISLKFKLIVLNFLREESLQKFCLPVVDKFLSRYDANYITTDSCRFLDCLIDNLKHEISISNDGSLHLQILESVMQVIQKSEKEDIFFYRDVSKVKEIFNLFLIPFLKLIINDKDLQAYRDPLISKGEEKYKEIISSNNFQLLNEFMDEVLLSNEEKKEFKEKFNFLEEFIANGQFDTVDNVLGWMHGDEAQMFKISLNHLCCSSVPKNYETVVKLLKWFFDTQDDPIINNCKDTALLKDFSRELIYNMWFRTNFINIKDKNPTVRISEKILKFVFGSEEEIINFKTNELGKDASCVRFFCDNLLKNSNTRKKEADFSAIIKFFNFCALPNEKINDIKKLISDDINQWLERYGVGERRLDIVAPLLDWIHGSKCSNRKLLVDTFQNDNYVNSYYKNRKVSGVKNLKKRI